MVNGFNAYLTMSVIGATPKLTIGDLSRPVPEEIGTEADEVAASFNYLTAVFSNKIEVMKKASAKMKCTAVHHFFSSATNIQPG